MKSRIVEIDKRRSKAIFLKSFGGRYKISVDECADLALALKRRYLLTDQWVLSFDYKVSFYIAVFHFVINGKEIRVRNILYSPDWTSFSLDLTEYKDLINEHILTKYSVAIRFLVIPQRLSTTFEIKNIRLRPRTDEEKKKAASRTLYLTEKQKQHFFNLPAYLYDNVFSSQIVQVRTCETKIEVKGTFDNKMPNATFYLCEIPLFKDLAVESLESIKEFPPKAGPFETAVPRMTTQYGQPYDRIYSRWVLAYRYNGQLYICSSARYTDAFQLKRHTFPQWTPKTKKGIGGFKFNHLASDIENLNISYITFNIRINNFLRLDPGQDRIPFEYQGKTYYADKRKIEKYDQTLLYAAQHNIDVSAIILVYPELWSRDPQAGRIFEHPEYQRSGVYTMPNMTNIDSFNLYAASIDFLAARYNRPEGKHGKIHRWIVHNEVNSNGIWVSTGNKTPMEFMDIYIKSMRLIYYTAQKYNTGAEVFISLDHFWAVNYEKDTNCYPAQELLQLLLDYCKVEGDFKWGVAIHPYPEDLINPRSWEDPKAEFFLNTPYVTFKNLEVLDKWIKNPDTFYNGQKRTLFLSEQNPNSLDYTEAALQEQAAGLAYALKKVEALSGIDAYIAHSWIDAHYEGGLKIGLRKYPDDPADPYGRKPAWFVFRDWETQRENETFEFAKKQIGITSWSQIFHEVEVEDKQNKTQKKSALNVYI